MGLTSSVVSRTGATLPALGVVTRRESGTVTAVVSARPGLTSETAPERREALVCPGFRGVEIPGFSCHGDDAVALELYRREPAELAVTATTVVPDLEVVEHRVRELDAGVPLLPIE